MMFHEPWKQNLLALSVIYAMLERRKRFRTQLSGPDARFAHVLDQMQRTGFLTSNRGEYAVTPKGRELRKQMVAMFDHALQFEIFGAYDFGCTLTSDEYVDETDEGRGCMVDNKFDPRFKVTGGVGCEDLRLAVMTFLADQGKIDFDPRVVVFMQKLADNKITGDPEQMFREIERIVGLAYKWQDLAPGDEELAVWRATALYRAGMTELKKRQGTTCSRCKSPLAMFKAEAERDNKTLDDCLVCGISFRDDMNSNTIEICPQCDSSIAPHQHRCPGCSARIDRRYRSGSVIETESFEVVTEDVIWVDCGGYERVYYDDYDIGLAVGLFAPTWRVDAWVVF